MMLFALAVLFLFLGIYSIMNSGNDPAAELANQGGAAASSSETAEPASSSAPETSAEASESESPTVDAAGVPDLCVLNAGSQSGLAKQVGDQLSGAGFKLGTPPANLATQSISENTIFYDEGNEEAAQKVAEAVPGGADVQPRPGPFTRCPGELVVIVVS